MNKVIIAGLAEKFQVAGIGDMCIAGSGAMLFYDEVSCSALRSTDIDLIVRSETLSSYKKIVSLILDIDEVFPSTTYSNQLVCVDFRGVKVDIIPSNAEILGYKNNWFKLAFDIKPYIQLSSHVIVMNSVLFVATKVEAALDQIKNQTFHKKHRDDVLHILNHIQLPFSSCIPDKLIYQFIYKGLISLGINPKDFLPIKEVGID